MQNWGHSVRLYKGIKLFLFYCDQNIFQKGAQEIKDVMGANILVTCVVYALTLSTAKTMGASICSTKVNVNSVSN